MKRATVYALSTMLGLTGQFALPQDYGDAPEKREARRQEDLPPAGFWPTQTMMERFIDRVTEDMARAYDLDDDQLYECRELFKRRFIPWLQEHRAQIQRATNDFFEAWLDDKPPSPEFVADLAQRMLPLLDGFADVVEDAAEEMRAYLTEEQQGVLDSNLAAIRMGISVASQRLGLWAEGGFDPARHWHRSPDHVPPGADEPGAAPPVSAQAPPTGPGGITKGPKDKWAKYVEDFIRHYQLTKEQQASAYRYLRVQQEQRDKYLRRHSARFARAEQELRDAKTDREREQAKHTLQQRAKTLDNKFTVLKEKLETLPSRQQRLAAQTAKNQNAKRTP